MTVEPTWPEPPVTKTFMPASPPLLARRGGARRLRERRRPQHLPVMVGAVVEPLVPQFEGQQPPDLAREAAGAVEVGEHRVRIEERPLARVAAAEDIFDELAQFAGEPFLERHRKAHLVA